MARKVGAPMFARSPSRRETYSQKEQTPVRLFVRRECENWTQVEFGVCANSGVRIQGWPLFFLAAPSAATVGRSASRSASELAERVGYVCQYNKYQLPFGTRQQRQQQQPSKLAGTFRRFHSRVFYRIFSCSHLRLIDPGERFIPGLSRTKSGCSSWPEQLASLRTCQVTFAQTASLAGGQLGKRASERTNSRQSDN